MLKLGAKKSCIRELFEYGLKRTEIVGKENILDFSIGNPSIPAPDEVSSAFVDILRNTDSLMVHGYTPGPGAMDARKSVADELNDRYKAAIRAENIFFTCGAATALVSVIRALAIENAEIIAIAPYFPEYRPFVEQNGARFIPVPADTAEFQIDLTALAARITCNTQAVIINSPNNPSGVIYHKETLEALAVLLEEKSAKYGHPIYIIADEPYRELVYDGAEVPFLPTTYRNTIICYSYSKSLSLPCERIGYICVPDAAEDSDALFSAIAGAARCLGHVCAPALLQRVIARCVKSRPDLASYDRNRKLLYDALTSYGYECVKPNGAFYMFIKAPGGDAKIFSSLAKKQDLLLVPGGDFGCPEYFRVCTCVSYEMIKRSLPIFKALIDHFSI